MGAAAAAIIWRGSALDADDGGASTDGAPSLLMVPTASSGSPRLDPLVAVIESTSTLVVCAHAAANDD